MNLLKDFDGFAIFFVVCAAIGGFFVLLRFVMQMLGSSGIDSDLLPNDDLHHADSDLGFKLLSLQGMSAFLLMFGLVGLALYEQNQVGMAVSIIGGVVAGLVAVWVIGKLFALAARLQASGNIASDAMLGSEGTVYQSIPSGGSGRVMLVVQGRQRESDAVSADGNGLTTGTPVRVVRVSAGVVTVERIDS